MTPRRAAPLALCVAFLALAACSRSDGDAKAKAAPRPPAVPVTAATVETRDAMARLAVQNLADVLAGRPCANIVNR